MSAVFGVCAALFLSLALEHRLGAFREWCGANPLLVWLCALGAAVVVLATTFKLQVGILEALLNGLLALTFYAAFFAVLGRFRTWLK